MNVLFYTKYVFYCIILYESCGTAQSVVNFVCLSHYTVPKDYLVGSSPLQIPYFIFSRERTK